MLETVTAAVIMAVAVVRVLAWGLVQGLQVQYQLEQPRPDKPAPSHPRWQHTSTRTSSNMCKAGLQNTSKNRYCAILFYLPCLFLLHFRILCALCSESLNVLPLQNVSWCVRTLTEHFIRNTCTPTHSCTYLIGLLCGSRAVHKILQIRPKCLR